MAQTEQKSRKWIWYTLYGVLLTIILLYYRFPDDAFEDYVQGRLRSVSSDLLFSFDGVSLSFPPGVNLNAARISTAQRPEKVIALAESLSIRPKVWSLLKGDPEYRIESRAYGGDIAGSIRIIKKGTGTTFSASIELNSIHLDDRYPLPDIVSSNLKGILSGLITYSGIDRSLIKGTGEASLSLLNGSLVLTPPILRLKNIDFREIQLKMALNNQRLSLSSGDLKGKDVLAEASGSISLNKELMESRINLRGTLEPLADLFKDIPDSREAVRFFKKNLKDGKLPFRILGTMSEPRIQFM